MYDEFWWIKAILFVLILLGTYTLLEIGYGNIIIQFTGSDRIERLEHLNAECNEQLNKKCGLCPEVKCVESGGVPEYIVGLSIGVLIGFWYFVLFGEGTRKWLLKQLKKQNEVKKE